MEKYRLILGYGINDADYPVTKSQKVDGKSKTVWVCPFYQAWRNILHRCYSSSYQTNNPSYIGCYTVPEWHYFMAFRAWMEKQDWQGKVLDKDILFVDNKMYSPSTCVFVESRINLFLTDCERARGDWPIGVHFNRQKNKFQARCRDVVTTKQKNLGFFNEPEEAHQAWLVFKLEQAKILGSQQTDERVAKALIERYENYRRKI